MSSFGPLRRLLNLLPFSREEPWDYEVREPISWMVDEGPEEKPPLPAEIFRECPACPWRCPECNSEMTQYIHDGWECLLCGIVF